jgi:hypothetical protein
MLCLRSHKYIRRKVVDKRYEDGNGEREGKRKGEIPGGTRTLPPGALTSTRGGGVECDAPMICYSSCSCEY